MDYRYEQQSGGVDASGSNDASTSQLAAGGSAPRQSNGIKSETSLTLQGPLEVAGSVKSMGSVTFVGDFAVADKVEAYGDIDIFGNVNCRYVVHPS